MHERRGSWLTYLLALVFLLAATFPFGWMLLSSIKSLRELYTVPPVWLPQVPTLANYTKVLFSSNIPRYFVNSAVISIGSTAVALLLAILAAYGFARFKFRGKQTLQASILVSQLLPTATIVVPLYITLGNLGLVNSYSGLILVYLIHTLPLERVDVDRLFSSHTVRARGGGDDRRRVAPDDSRRILLPLSVPGIVAIIVYSFVTTWNEFIFALCFATDSRVKTLPIGLAEFTTEFNTDWGSVMAASVVMTAPILVVFLAMQRLFVGGLTAGATKG